MPASLKSDITCQVSAVFFMAASPATATSAAALSSQSLALSWNAVNSTLSSGTVSVNTIRNTLMHSVSSEISSFVPEVMRTLRCHSITMPMGHRITLSSSVKKM